VKRRLSYFIFLIISACCLSGCGYHAMNWDNGPFAGDGKTVNIPLFVNKTFKPNVEGVLANALIDQFAKKKGLQVESSDADLTLSGEVLDYHTTAVSYSAADTVKEYSASMKISATLRRTSTMKVLWKGELTWDQSFPANTDIALQQNAEDAAIREICGKLAQELYVTISSDF
jgi:outer membrane lipopolysaccharide assembly protein LptE/RlpB